jgi:hypothetical protein
MMINPWKQALTLFEGMSSSDKQRPLLPEDGSSWKTALDLFDNLVPQFNPPENKMNVLRFNLVKKADRDFLKQIKTVNGIIKMKYNPGKGSQEYLFLTQKGIKYANKYRKQMRKYLTYLDDINLDGIRDKDR